MLKLTLFIFCVLAEVAAVAQNIHASDQGDGTYKNPVLHADYSDPDAVRVGDDYYMTSSSFEDIPGLPILHSKDLVNWKLVAHALQRLPQEAYYSTPRHGSGVWAPALRYHKGEFYLYYPDPDFGIYLLKAKKAEGPWSAPVLVCAGKGLIDPCPLWDDDGAAYLAHAYAGSRAGIKSVLVVKRLSTDGTRTLDEGVMVYDGHRTDPTIEGPKFYKREGWYYIFAPAGGVPTGWQLVLRSKNVYGPYERKVVMDQGASPVNGPHQGAWITTQTGEDWFLHFQDKEAYGRVVHLQPMAWKNGWPVIGTDSTGSGKGTPVLRYRKPNVGRSWPKATPPESDEFNANTIGRQWQWPANPSATWAFPDPGAGVLRLFSVSSDSARNLWEQPNVLQQKFPAEVFTATTKLTLHPNGKLTEQAGLAVMGLSYAGIALRFEKGTYRLIGTRCADAGKGTAATDTVLAASAPTTVYLRVMVSSGAHCRFSWSLDGTSFTEWPFDFVAQPGRWKGAKLGIFCTRAGTTNDSGAADFDWFRIN